MFPVWQYGPVVRLYCRTLSITVQQPHKQQQLGLAFGRRTNWEKKQGDDDTILFQLDRVPHDIVAMYIILTASTPEMRFSDIKSTLRVIDIQTQHTICNFTPARHPNATAMFLVLLAREDGQSWVLSPIEDTHPTARNFGSLMPYIKSYTRDLIPTIQIDPTERVAILRESPKGCRLCNGQEAMPIRCIATSALVTNEQLCGAYKEPAMAVEQQNGESTLNPVWKRSNNVLLSAPPGTHELIDCLECPLLKENIHKGTIQVEQGDTNLKFRYTIKSDANWMV
jgi:hypothetical protein